MADAAGSSGMTKLCLFGPTGGVGSLVAEQALARDIDVRGAARDWPDDFGSDPQMERVTVELLEGNLHPVVKGCEAVISTVGPGREPATLADPPPLYSLGTKRIVEAMRDTGVRRLVVISAAFVDRQASVPEWFRAASLPLSALFADMRRMERVLSGSPDIAWTAARPGWLLDQPRSQDFEVSERDLPTGTLRTRRADLAQFLIDCAIGTDWVGKTPFIARREADTFERPTALLEELHPD